MIYHQTFKVAAQVAALFFILSPLTAPSSETDIKEIPAANKEAASPLLPKPDPAKAIREKARAGDRDARFEYGCRLLYGHGGVERDILLAVEYLDRAAGAGHAQAASVLGYEYNTGRILKKDARQAIRYYEQAANLGDGAAAYELGSIYDLGEDGVPVDKKKSFLHYGKAIPLIQKEAEQELSEPYVQGKTLVSCITLGHMFMEGMGTPIDQKKAFSWYLKAATQGDPMAQVEVGNCYITGTGTTKDAREAQKWISMADINGNPHTIFTHAMLTLQNTGKAAAEKEFDKAAEKGDAHMKATVGDTFRHVYQNPQKAFFWTRQAAELGNANAQCAMGVAYWKADGTTWNPIQAIKWLRKAIAAGQPEASQNLSTIIQYLSAIAVIMLGLLAGAFFLIIKWKTKQKEEKNSISNGK